MFKPHTNGGHRPIAWLHPWNCPIILNLKPFYILVFIEVLLASWVQTLASSWVATALNAIHVNKTPSRSMNGQKYFWTLLEILSIYSLNDTEQNSNFIILFWRVIAYTAWESRESSHFASCPQLSFGLVKGHSDNWRDAH